MVFTVASHAILMEHDRDPKLEIWEEVEPFLKDITPIGSFLVAAAYVRPEKTKGGIYLADGDSGVRKEDSIQGKVHLLLKCGPLAFYEENEGAIYPERKPTVGDWIVIRVSDGVPFLLGKRTCRLVDHDSVRLIVDRPDILL